MRPSATLVILLLVLNASVFGQDQWNPPGGASYFKDSGVVKVYKNAAGKSVVGLIRTPFEFQTKFVSKTKSETRSRLVTDPNTGEQKEETYVVEVPYTEQIESKVERPARLEIPMERAKIWKTRGDKLTDSQAADFLAKPRRCFYIDNPYSYHAREDTNPVKEFHAKMLSEEIVVVWFNRKYAQPLEKPTSK